MKISALTSPVVKIFNKVINPISNNKVSFKGQLDHDKFESQQQNDPEIHIDEKLMK